jgi:hypothetical protein
MSGPSRGAREAADAIPTAAKVDKITSCYPRAPRQGSVRSVCWRGDSDHGQIGDARYILFRGVTKVTPSID